MIYHVYNKSIADYVIFNDDNEFARMMLAIRYYQIEGQPINLALFMRSEKAYTLIKSTGPLNKRKLVTIIAYCLMPTHFHLILEGLRKNAIAKFISDALNSYTRYFNTKHGRKGPLWEARSKKILVETDEQLLHLTRYIHLNPVTAYLVDKPEEWAYSSYREYLSRINKDDRICDYGHRLEIDPDSYKDFVEDRISYQRQLAKIKKLTLD